MKTVLWHDGERVTTWVGERLHIRDFGPSSALGLVENGELIAGTVYNIYNGLNVFMNLAGSDGKRWATREFLYACFAYPFQQLGCRRVTAVARADNLASNQLATHLGFRFEGRLHGMYEDGVDQLMYGMMRAECRFLARPVKLRATA